MVEENIHITGMKEKADEELSMQSVRLEFTDVTVEKDEEPVEQQGEGRVDDIMSEMQITIEDGEKDTAL